MLRFTLHYIYVHYVHSYSGHRKLGPNNRMMNTETRTNRRIVNIVLVKRTVVSVSWLHNLLLHCNTSELTAHILPHLSRPYIYNVFSCNKISKSANKVMFSNLFCLLNVNKTHALYKAF
jgi:hypothetical protein